MTMVNLQFCFKVEKLLWTNCNFQGLLTSMSNMAEKSAV
jgi:hypothetical protein